MLVLFEIDSIGIEVSVLLFFAVDNAADALMTLGVEVASFMGTCVVVVVLLFTVEVVVSLEDCIVKSVTRYKNY